MILTKEFFLQPKLEEFVMMDKQNKNFFFLIIIICILLFGIYSNYKKKIERNSSIPKISELLETNPIA